MFTVKQGMRCRVRRVGATAWAAFVTTHDSEFIDYEVADSGGTWVFASGGWELAVSPLHVGRPPRGRAARFDRPALSRRQPA